MLSKQFEVIWRGTTRWACWWLTVKKGAIELEPAIITGQVFRMTIEKHFISADALLVDSIRLARLVHEAEFMPTHIVGVWRGGAPIGIAVQEFLEYRGIETDHIAIRTSSYTGIGQQAKQVRVFGEGYLVDTLNAEDRLLIVDDVFDSGRSIEAILEVLRAKCRRNFPAETRIATVYYKPARNVTALKPDFFVHECDDWLVFPHEICGLKPEEIAAKGEVGAEILKP